MIFVNKDEDIRYFNAAIITKMNDYHIELPSLKDINLYTTDTLEEKTEEITSHLNGTDWLTDTLACSDSSRGCQGCNDDYGFIYDVCQGCYNVNTGCIDCQGTNAVDVCVQCYSSSNNTNEEEEIIQVCIECDGGCYFCDSACYGCNEGCQGAQTCTNCNTGEGCVSGCQSSYVPAKPSCTTGYVICATGYTPACDASQATYGCVTCNTECQGNDICSGYSACSTCVSCNRGNTCIAGNQYIESAGCTSNNKSCVVFFFGTCKTGYSSNSDDATTCKNTFSNKGVSCSLDYKVDRATGLSCTDGFRTDSGELNCSSNFSSDGSGGNYCKTTYRQGDTSCQGDYDSSIKTGEGQGMSCVRSYAQGGSSCYYKYTGTQTTAECVTTYVGRDGSICDSGFKINTGTGYADCPAGFATPASGGINCRTGYSFSSGGDPICVSGYTAQGVTCASNYNNTCEACNVSSDNVCTNCVGGRAPVCRTCVGTTNNANCPDGCVLGQAESCNVCVDGQGGCIDCQGCDEGCNNNVSCYGYAVSSGGFNVCVGQFTDTTCNQSCLGNYDSATMCLSNQNCTSCDTSCVGCNASCYSCNSSCNGGCQSGQCTSGNETCKECHGGCVNGQCSSCHEACQNNEGVCMTCHDCNEAVSGCNNCNIDCNSCLSCQTAVCVSGYNVCDNQQQCTEGHD